jgi:hypothetical protein
MSFFDNVAGNSPVQPLLMKTATTCFDFWRATGFNEYQCQGRQQQGILTTNNQPKTCRCDGGGKGEEVQPGGSVGEVQGDYGYKDGAGSIILSACGVESMIL